MDTIKTIRMSRTQAAIWLGALAHGMYQQTRCTLFRPESDAIAPAGYCCLGVLQHSLTGEVSYDQSTMNPGSKYYCGLPKREWLIENGITFVSQVTGKPQSGTATDTAPAVQLTIDWISPISGIKYRAGTWQAVSVLNDAGMTFAELRPLLMNHIEYTD